MHHDSRGSAPARHVAQRSLWSRGRIGGRIGLGWVLLGGLGCGGPAADGPDKDVDSAVQEPPRSTAVQAHAAECAAELGPPPAWDVAEDTREVPVTVEGVLLSIEAWTPDATCDRPDLLRRSCMPGTRVGRRTGTTTDGRDDPDVVWMLTLRQAEPDPSLTPGWFDDVALIGHRASTGATCFFQAFPTAEVTAVPSPLDAPEAELAWEDPSTVAAADCVRCHGADPWLHSPWIDQLRDPDDAERPYVPVGATVDGPYWVVGAAFAGWAGSMETVRPDDNACVACHRVGLREACERLVPYATGRGGGLPLSAAGATFPLSHWMPPSPHADADAWSDAWQHHVTDLLDCCRAPSDARCNRAPLPGRP